MVEKSEIIDRYIELKEEKKEISKKLDEIKEEMEFMKNLIINNFQDGEVINDKVVKISERTQERLKTQEVRKYLGEKVGDFVRHVSYIVVDVKGVDER